MSNFTLQVTVQVDVQNAESIQQARESVFALLSAPKESKSRKGRPASGPKATVTGVQIPVPTALMNMTLAPEKVEELKELMKNSNSGGTIVGPSGCVVAMSVESREVTETTP